MELSADNAFVGAVVTKGELQLTVYKVNSKTFYGGIYTINQYKDLLEQKQKGDSFKIFCSKNNINQYDYKEWNISDEEAARKDTAAESLKAQVILPLGVRKAIKEFYEDSVKKNRPLRLRYTDFRGETIRVITSVNDCLLITYKGDEYLYCVSTEETIKVPLEKRTFTEKTVPWNKLLSYKTA